MISFANSHKRRPVYLAAAGLNQLVTAPFSLRDRTDPSHVYRSA
jgi:hypothetical protein